jgi:hypothetical protein
MKHHKNRSVALLLATTALSSLFGIDSQAFGLKCFPREG